MRKTLIPVLLFIFVLSVYLKTLSPSVWIGGDAGEVTTAAYVAGILHPSGYPLYTLLGYLFTKLPFGVSVAWKVNLLSAALQAATVVIVYFVILEVLRSVKGVKGINDGNKNRQRNLLATFSALTGSLILAFSYLFWHYALVAEVFPLNNFLVVILFLVLLKWVKTNSQALLFLACFISGLGLCNHLTFLLILPPAFAFALFVSRKFKLEELRYSFLFFLLGLTPYLYLPLRAAQNPPLQWGEPNTLLGFLRMVVRADYGIFTATVGAITEPTNSLAIFLRESRFLHALASNFSFVGVPLFVLGLIFAWQKRRELSNLLVLFAGSLFLAGIFFLGYLNLPISTLHGQGMIERFYLLPLTLSAIFVGLGGYFVFAKILLVRRVRYVFSFLFLTTIIMLILNYRAVDKSSYFLAEDYTINMLKTLKPNDLLIVNGDGPTFLVLYLDLVEKKVKNPYVAQGILGIDWYTHQLASRYQTDFGLSYESRKISLEEFVQSNEQNYRILANTTGDESIEQSEKYGYLPHGLLYEIKDKYEQVEGPAYIEENRKLWQETYSFRSVLPIDSYKSIFDKELVSDIAIAHFNLGVIYDGIGLSQEAIKEYEIAIKINPHNIGAYSNMAFILAKEEKVDEAEDALLTAVKNINVLSKEEDVKSLYSNLVLFYEKIKKNSQRAEEYRLLLSR